MLLCCYGVMLFGWLVGWLDVGLFYCCLVVWLFGCFIVMMFCRFLFVYFVRWFHHSLLTLILLFFLRSSLTDTKRASQINWIRFEEAEALVLKEYTAEQGGDGGGTDRTNGTEATNATTPYVSDHNDVMHIGIVCIDGVKWLGDTSQFTISHQCILINVSMFLIQISFQNFFSKFPFLLFLSEH